jgi:hypothetical protein
MVPSQSRPSRPLPLSPEESPTRADRWVDFWSSSRLTSELCGGEEASDSETERGGDFQTSAPLPSSKRLCAIPLPWTPGELVLGERPRPSLIPEWLTLPVSRREGLEISPHEASPERACPCRLALGLGDCDKSETLSKSPGGCAGLGNVRELTAPAIFSLGCRAEDRLGRIPIPFSRSVFPIGPAERHRVTSTLQRPPAPALSSTM